MSTLSKRMYICFYILLRYYCLKRKHMQAYRIVSWYIFQNPLHELTKYINQYYWYTSQISEIYISNLSTFNIYIHTIYIIFLEASKCASNWLRDELVSQTCSVVNIPYIYIEVECRLSNVIDVKILRYAYKYISSSKAEISAKYICSIFSFVV